MALRRLTGTDSILELRRENPQTEKVLSLLGVTVNDQVDLPERFVQMGGP